jgi:PKHD-type hydroxylase|tara:strand:+ start:401 stop:892 length:492 start_codon:yes stop_codon:yes gene_type:complete
MIHYTNISKSFSVPDTLEDGVITEKSGKVKRNSKVFFIKDNKICKEIFNIINETTVIQLTDIEPLQYSEYGVGGEYGWHRDVHEKPYPNGLVRKMSFSTILNNDFEGGEFDIETKNPADKKRYDTFDNKKHNTIIFPSHMWHRVRPVKSGVRKSIVGWVLGPP